MGKLFDGGASFGFSLNYNTAVPVDTRMVVANLDDLKNPKTWVSGTYDAVDDANNVYVIYLGLDVVVVSEKTKYIYVPATVSGSLISDATSWIKVAVSTDVSDQVSTEDTSDLTEWEDVF